MMLLLQVNTDRLLDLPIDGVTFSGEGVNFLLINPPHDPVDEERDLDGVELTEHGVESRILVEVQHTLVDVD
jgi:hypothetical protein